MRILITGAQGFVGRYLVACLLSSSSDLEVTGVGRSVSFPNAFTHTVHWGGKALRAPLPEFLNVANWTERYSYSPLNICDRPLVVDALRKIKPHIIVHLASGLRDDAHDYLFRTNVVGTIRLLEGIAESRVRPHTILLGSTGGIYGSPSAAHLPISESDPCSPQDIYSTSKLASEHVSRILSAHYDLPVIWARLFNLVGPGQDERHVCGKISMQLAGVSAGLLPAKVTVGDLTATRDFIDVRDVALALQTLIEKGSPGLAYNVGSGLETSISTVLDNLVSIAELDGRLEIPEYLGPPSAIRRQFADVGRLANLGFCCTYKLRESLREAFLYYTNTVSSVGG